MAGPATPVVVKAMERFGKGGISAVLAVDLGQPVTGSVTLNLDIVPQAFGPKTRLFLPLPAPLQGVSKSGVLAYRLDAAEIRSPIA